MKMKRMAAAPVLACIAAMFHLWAEAADVVDLSVAGMASAQASDIVSSQSNPPADIPGMTLTVATAGGPILLLFFGEAVQITNTGGSQPVEADIGIFGPNGWITGASFSFYLGYGDMVSLPVSLQAFDMPIAGTHTYTVKWAIYGLVIPLGPRVLLHYRGFQIAELRR